MIIGGLIGFLIGILVGSAQDASGSTILWRSSVAALLAGVSLRWWGRVWIKCLIQSQQQRAAGAVESEVGAVQAKV